MPASTKVAVIAAFLILALLSLICAQLTGGGLAQATPFAGIVALILFVILTFLFAKYAFNFNESDAVGLGIAFFVVGVVIIVFGAAAVNPPVESILSSVVFGAVVSIIYAGVMSILLKMW